MKRLDPEGFLTALAAATPAELVDVLIASGGFGVEGHDRIGLLALEPVPRLVEDAYLPEGQIGELWRRISTQRPRARSRRGGWNTMHATAWSFAWSDDSGPFTLIDPAGRLAWFENDQLHLRGGAPIPRIAMAAVEPYLDNAWIRRGVRVRLFDGALHPVAFEDDETPSLDPTYDGLNLMADTGWTHELARALSRGLGPPVVDCTG